jgi:hypothetical protein
MIVIHYTPVMCNPWGLCSKEVKISIFDVVGSNPVLDLGLFHVRKLNQLAYTNVEGQWFF